MMMDEPNLKLSSPAQNPLKDAVICLKAQIIIRPCPLFPEKVNLMTNATRKLQGTAVDVTKTGETVTDSEKDRWEKCVFTIELTNFSSRTPNEALPEGIKGKRVKLVRLCCFIWHFRLGVKKTLDSDETEAVLAGRPTKSVYW
jgi:hypothetical protein